MRAARDHRLDAAEFRLGHARGPGCAGAIDAQPPFDEAHYLDGFGYPDGKFRFKPDWTKVPSYNDGADGALGEHAGLPDHWGVIEAATEEHPFRLATSPARNFLNSSFTETPTSLEKERRPEVMIHPDDAAAQGIADGDWVKLKNHRGEVFLRANFSTACGAAC